jgi:hypothetical protein
MYEELDFLTAASRPGLKDRKLGFPLRLLLEVFPSLALSIFRFQGNPTYEKMAVHNL